MDSTSSQQFCVRWNSHLGSLGAAFPQLLAGQRFVDVTLACEGHQLHCHRLVLAACSTYFESLLDENPCKHPIIILPRDIKLWEIQALVDFMYKGEVNVSQAGLSDLLKCAEILQIRGLCGSDAALNLNTVNSTSTTTTTAAAGSSTAVPASTTTTTNVSTTEIDSQTVASSSSLSLTQNSIVDRSETIESTSPTRNRHQSKTGGKNNGGGTSSTSSQLGVPQNTVNSTTKQRAALNIAQQRDNVVLFNKVKSETAPYRTSTPNRTGSKSETINVSVSKIEPIDVSMDGEVIDDEDSVNPANDKTAVSDDSFSGKYLDYLEGAKSEFPLANVICEYDSGAIQMDNLPGRRVRRSEATLRQAAECVSRGQTFQTVSDMFNIPISTIRFFMARKGILPRRKRGRSAGVSIIGSGSQNTSSNDAHSTSNDRGTHSRSASPLEPPFHFANYKLPELKPKLL